MSTLIFICFSYYFFSLFSGTRFLALIFICFLFVFSYHSSENGRQFRGDSQFMSFMLTVIGGIGWIATYVALIWSFWPFKWWQSILTSVCGVELGALTSPLFQRTVLGIILSPILVVVFGILSFVNLLTL